MTAEYRTANANGAPRVSTLAVRLCTSLGVVLLAAAFEPTPTLFSVEWWLLVVAALLLGHAAAEIKGRTPGVNGATG